jgi:hypothetical protein
MVFIDFKVNLFKKYYLNHNRGGPSHNDVRYATNTSTLPGNFFNHHIKIRAPQLYFRLHPMLPVIVFQNQSVTDAIVRELVFREQPSPNGHLADAKEKLKKQHGHKNIGIDRIPLPHISGKDRSSIMLSVSGMHTQISPASIAAHNSATGLKLRR